MASLLLIGIRTGSRGVRILIDQATPDGSVFVPSDLTPSLQILEVQQQFIAISRRTGIIAIPGTQLDSDHNQKSENQESHCQRQHRIDEQLSFFIKEQTHVFIIPLNWQSRGNPFRLDLLTEAFSVEGGILPAEYLTRGRLFRFCGGRSGVACAGLRSLARDQ